MKIKRRLALWLALSMLTLPTSAFALPLAETEAVNLPGWVGGLLAVLALLLPILFRYWVKQNW